MTKKINGADSSFFSQLTRGGIPLDDEVLGHLKADSRGLSIYQTGTSIDSIIIDLAYGGAGYILSVAIYNDTKRIVRPREIRLEMAWPEPQFRWLKDPLTKMPREFSYSLPPHGPKGFEREIVLNHRLRGNGRLCPGECLDGFLLGVGQEPIPVECCNRQMLQAQLSIFDERGNRYESRLKLCVSREEQLSRRRATEKPCGLKDWDAKGKQQGIVRTRKVAA
jgi:hypothetical protein